MIIVIESSGHGQTDHFTRNGATYLVIAENFNSKLSVHQIDIQHKKVKLIQSLVIPGIASCAVDIIGDKLFLIGGWKTESIVFEFLDTTSEFLMIQAIPTAGPHDVETVFFDNRHFLFFFRRQRRGLAKSTLQCMSLTIVSLDYYTKF